MSEAESNPRSGAAAKQSPAPKRRGRPARTAADAQHGRVRWRTWLAVAGATVAISAMVVFASRWEFWTAPSPHSPPPAPEDSISQRPAEEFAIAPLSDSPFLNTRPEASLVGSEVCQACHEDEHESFRHTGMGRSMAAVDPAREPPDGQFDHFLSNRRYEVRRKDGQMWHRELLLADGPEEVVLSEFPVKYVTGSGRHSLTYVVETDGFLVESPITWYTSRQGWGMSPGYDRASHSGFQREIGESCLICHSGRTETIDRSVHRARVIEATISCERCHGPGSLHVEKRSSAADSTKESPDAIDYTIVNPAHLSRELAEAVCQQCHLRTSATVVSRGRRHSDFRPGLPLQDVRQDYSLEIPDKPMTVVGHVEQMHLSRCYQGSSTFTCVTCHSPHGEPPPTERVAYYKSVCLQCHQAEHCTVDEQRLAAESAENDCVQCHMPTSPTDIPHLAFTHHRVGIHDSSAGKEPAVGESGDRPGVLRAFLDVSRLSPIDQKRSLGMAYLDLSIHEDIPIRRTAYQRQALAILAEVHAAGLKDSIVSASLASLRYDLGMPGVASLAHDALADDHLSGMERSNSLFLIADTRFKEGRYQETLQVLQPLNRLRRHAVHWLLKAQCEEALGNQSATVESLETALKINPGIAQARRFLVDHYQEIGDTQRAAWHKQRLDP